MPANMMRDAVGGRWKVIGSSMAMVATGPMPGSTPISVPTMRPTSAYNRFWNERATPIPRARLLRRSILPDPFDNRDVHAEADLEDDDAHDRQHDDVGDDLPQHELVAAEGGEQDQGDQGGEHAG